MRRKIDPIIIVKVISTLIVYCLHAYLFTSANGFAITNHTWFLQTPAWAGVWIFFFISGYNNGQSFLGTEKKYDLTINSWFKFYLRRFFKIIIPTWLFIIIAALLFDFEFFYNNPRMVLRIITLTFYNNAPGSLYIGATWYVFVLAQLYLLTPVLCLIIKRILKGLEGKKRNVIIIVLMATLTTIGLVARAILYKNGYDWSSKIYVPFYMNIDIYACGILSGLIEKHEINRYYQMGYFGGVILFILSIILNTRIYYLGNNDVRMIHIYQIIFPSIYIVVLAICFNLWYGRKCSYYTVENAKKWEKTNIRTDNINRIIALWADISFEFYLLHSLILKRISDFLAPDKPNIVYHALVLLLGFSITTLLSVLFKYGYSIGFKTRIGKRN